MDQRGLGSIGARAAVTVLLGLAPAGGALRAEPPPDPPPAPAAAAIEMETTVVSPARTELSAARVPPAVTVVAREVIERKQLVTVADALREVPGVAVVESGSRGSVVNVFLRGADTDQVLVLVDGVRMNSPTLGAFDFSNLTAENLERIEVTRGWGATLYGADAIGGVVHLFTRRGAGPPRGSVSAAGGNGGTHREQGELSGGAGPLSYSGSFTNLESEGFEGTNDGYTQRSASGRVGVDLREAGEGALVFRLSDADFGNRFGNNFLGGPDPDSRQETRQAVLRGVWEVAPAAGWTVRAGGSWFHEQQDFRDRPDPLESDATTSDIASGRIGGDLQAELRSFGGALLGIYGLEIESRHADFDSRFESPAFGAFTTSYDESTRRLAGFVLEQLVLDATGTTLVGGARLDDDERFGSEWSPSGGLVQEIRATGGRLRASYARGFKAPTFNELFFPDFGNLDLEAERSWEVAVGVEQPLLGERLRAEVTFFHREVDDLIAGVPAPGGSFRAENTGSSRARGVETVLEASPWPGVTAAGTHTLLDVDAQVAGRVRRPRHSGSIALAAVLADLLRKGDRLSADLRLLLVGERRDFDPARFFAPAENDPYERVDLALAYGFAPGPRLPWRIDVFARVENLFDARYDEVLGFPARPVNVLGGVRIGL